MTPAGIASAYNGLRLRRPHFDARFQHAHSSSRATSPSCATPAGRSGRSGLCRLCHLRYAGLRDCGSFVAAREIVQALKRGSADSVAGGEPAVRFSSAPCGGRRRTVQAQKAWQGALHPNHVHMSSNTRLPTEASGCGRFVGAHRAPCTRHVTRGGAVGPLRRGRGSRAGAAASVVRHGHG